MTTTSALALAFVAGAVAGLMLNLADHLSSKAKSSGKRMFAAGKIPPKRKRAPAVELAHAAPECTGYWWPVGDMDTPREYVCERCERSYPATPAIAEAARSENRAGHTLWELAGEGAEKLKAEWRRKERTS